jgi:N-acetylneuraminate synthase
MKPIIIAEVGCNHMGNMEVAKKMIKVAAECGATVVKFQKRCNKELLTPEEYNAPHPVPENSYGDTYGEHREFLEFTADQHAELMHCCTENNVTYSTSVWDLTSAKEIVALSPCMIKIPSACNLNAPLLEYLCNNYIGDIHVSFGMTTIPEQQLIFNLFKSKGRLANFVLYSCTSGYLVPADQVCLLDISRLKEKYNDVYHIPIGFSGHHLGIALDAAAIALGATYIERHFTLDRTQKGTDHAASLEPHGLQTLVRDCNAVTMALTHKVGLLTIEKPQRAKLKKSQIKWLMEE